MTAPRAPDTPATVLRLRADGYAVEAKRIREEIRLLELRQRDHWRLGGELMDTIRALRGALAAAEALRADAREAARKAAG